MQTMGREREPSIIIPSYGRYDLESDALYSTKWFKGSREIHRYIPSDGGHSKTFSAPGIKVNVRGRYTKEVL